MTKMLSELLGAPLASFSETVRQLERFAGRPSHDIRLTTDVAQHARNALRDLMLDTKDTTSRELYASLLARYERDEQLARQALGVADDAAADDIVQAVQQYAATDATLQRRVFALKTSVAKRLLKAVAPKKTMKQLKYRSLDSLLKHEDAATVYTAAFFTETLAWRKKFLQQYSALMPSDFETRQIRVLHPTSGRWHAFADRVTQQHKHHMVAVKELGTIVMLPSSSRAATMALVNLGFLFGAMNDIASASSYMKMRQVQSDFGDAVRYVAEYEPMTPAKLGDMSVPWRVIHQYYARSKDAYNAEIFEPHMQKSDLAWIQPERIIARLHEALDFWREGRFTLRANQHESVSYNLLDVAVNYANALPFAARTTQFARQQLWQEFMLRYLSHDHVEQAVAAQLQPAFATIDS